MSHVLSTRPTPTRGLLRSPADDGVLLGLAGAHGLVLLLWPSFLTMGLGLWWNANTISHYFIHRPFFRAAGANAIFSVFLSLLLGLPQSVWRDRHLAHHAGVAPRIRPHPQLYAEIAAVACLWLGVLWFAPTLFWFALLPGLALGLALCAVHGHFEHVDGTISHYGWLYNLVFFNDGYHVEHHEHPTADWRRLAHQRTPGARTSRWPALLRWLEHPLETLERLILRRPKLQELVLDSHRRAWLEIVPRLAKVRTVGIVGGGIFPRTAILLRELLPDARLTLIDGNAKNLAVARRRLEAQGGRAVDYEQAWFDRAAHGQFDLLVFPLAYRGDDKQDLRRHLPARTVVFHDWLWDRQGDSVVVSTWLLKRMSLHSGPTLREPSASR